MIIDNVIITYLVAALECVSPCRYGSKDVSTYSTVVCQLEQVTLSNGFSSSFIDLLGEVGLLDLTKMTIAGYLQKRLGRMGSPVEIELTHAANRVNYNQVQKFRRICPRNTTQKLRTTVHTHTSTAGLSLSPSMPLICCTSL